MHGLSIYIYEREKKVSHLCAFDDIRGRVELVPSSVFLLTVPRRAYFVDPFCYFCIMFDFVMLSWLFCDFLCFYHFSIILWFPRSGLVLDS